MHVSQLYTYPIKSIRGVPLTSTALTTTGVPHDRRYMLVRQHTRSNPNTDPKASDNDTALPVELRFKSHYNPTTGLENLTITFWPELSLFVPSIDERGNTLTVEHRPPDREVSSIKIPIKPSVHGSDSKDQEEGGGNSDIDRKGEGEPLQSVQIVLHRSPTVAYMMPEWINDWFSACLGIDGIKLVYLGENRRPVLGNLAPNSVNGQPERKKGDSWLTSLKSWVPGINGGGAEVAAAARDEKMSFTDVAPFLVVTEESLAEVSGRLPEGVEMDVTKFRANIVLSGADEPYEEDYWGGLAFSLDQHEDDGSGIGNKPEIILTQNCGRCVSLNVDYETGEFGKGVEGTVLKRLMKDRRVDPGNKYSPVFGRYGFLNTKEHGDGSGENLVQVGDKAAVTKFNKERTVFHWPGIGSP